MFEEKSPKRLSYRGFLLYLQENWCYGARYPVFTINEINIHKCSNNLEVAPDTKKGIRNEKKYIN